MLLTIMRRLRFALPAAGAAALALAAVGGAASGGTFIPGQANTGSATTLSGLLPRAASPAVNTKLFAYVNEPNEPNNGIWLKDANGVLVTHLDPGTYEIDVDDRSDMSSFHLKGPGVDIATRIDEVVHTTWTVTLTDGTYNYFCDFLPGVMNGLFTVGNPPPPPPPPPPPARGCVVPKVKGKPFGMAKKALAAAHCSTGGVRRAFSMKIKKGRVISERPAARTHLRSGGKVDLVVSRGPRG